jgi:hypothetical protein
LQEVEVLVVISVTMEVLVEVEAAEVPLHQILVLRAMVEQQ